MKLCECGCGQPTRPAQQTQTRFGHIKGQPVRFVNGHQWKGKFVHSGAAHPNWAGGRIQCADGYTRVATPGHPRAGKHNYVLEHILIAEHAIGRYLPPRTPVHHVNGCCGDNRGTNLVICESDAYHLLLHQRQRAVQAGVPAHWRRCSRCHRYDEPANFYHYPYPTVTQIKHKRAVCKIIGK